jgi:hypothetical protein
MWNVEGFPVFQQTLHLPSLGCIRGFRKPYVVQAVDGKWDVNVMIRGTGKWATIQSGVNT